MRSRSTQPNARGSVLKSIAIWGSVWLASFLVGALIIAPVITALRARGEKPEKAPTEPTSTVAVTPVPSPAPASSAPAAPAPGPAASTSVPTFEGQSVTHAVAPTIQITPETVDTSGPRSESPRRRYHRMTSHTSETSATTSERTRRVHRRQTPSANEDTVAGSVSVTSPLERSNGDATISPGAGTRRTRARRSTGAGASTAATTTTRRRHRSTRATSEHATPKKREPAASPSKSGGTGIQKSDTIQ